MAKYKRRSAELVLANLDRLRDSRYRKDISEDQYRQQHDELWDELREGDRERASFMRKNQDRINDRAIIKQYGYKSIQDALRDGWRYKPDAECFVGGDMIHLSHHRILRKGFKMAYSKTYWIKSGYRVKDDAEAAGHATNRYGGWYCYTEDQVEVIVKKRSTKKYFSSNFNLLKDL
jgi:hypothetical protein